jgi:hypothetical protein
VTVTKKERKRVLGICKQCRKPILKDELGVCLTPSGPVCAVCSTQSMRVAFTGPVVEKLQKLVKTGLHGRSTAEVVERLVCRQLEDMERK